MIKWLKNYLLLEDGAAFRYLRLESESVVLTGHGRLRLHNWKGLAAIQLRHRQIVLSATCTYVTVHRSYRGYYHWLLESLPRLLEARQHIKQFTLLLPVTYADAFYEDSLRLFGIAAVERLQTGVLYRVPLLALPYTTEGMGDYDPTRLEQVKSALLHAVAPILLVAPPRRLYVSRRHATRRKVINEAAVEQLVIQYGFEVVCFEDYSFAEQLRLCASAEALVSIHGAGLANMLFLPSSSLVIEFRKFDNGHNYFFSQLATVLQHNYHLLYCTASDEQQSVQDADLVVNLADLAAILLASSLPANS